MVLMFDQCVELGIGEDIICISAFRIAASIGSEGVEADEEESGVSPAGTKVWCKICRGDNICSVSSGSVTADDVARGDGLAGWENACLSLPKTRLGVSGSAAAAIALGMLCSSMSSHRVDRANSLVLGFHLSL